jgi:hypothetical protein
MADILELLNPIHGDLRKLVLKNCCPREDGLLLNIVALYPDLEVLSLHSCNTIKSAGYCLIPNLKKLSELDISFCQVRYVYVKKPMFAYVNACRRTPLEIQFIYSAKKEITAFLRHAA